MGIHISVKFFQLQFLWNSTQAPEN